MVTSSQFRALALSLPGAEEKSHFGKPDFRVRNKIFAGLTEQPQRGYFKARPELQDELAASAAGVFAPAQGGWGKSGWTYVELPKVELALLRELLADAWKLIAPAKLVAAHEGEEASSAVRVTRTTSTPKGGKAKARRVRPKAER